MVAFWLPVGVYGDAALVDPRHPLSAMILRGCVAQDGHWCQFLLHRRRGQGGGLGRRLRDRGSVVVAACAVWVPRRGIEVAALGIVGVVDDPVLAERVARVALLAQSRERRVLVGAEVLYVDRVAVSVDDCERVVGGGVRAEEVFVTPPVADGVARRLDHWPAFGNLFMYQRAGRPMQRTRRLSASAFRSRSAREFGETL